MFVRPALNLRSAEVSAALGLFTVQTALLGAPRTRDLLLPIAPLGAMHGEAAGRALAERGAAVRPGARVDALEDGAAVLADGERVEADAFVVALPPRESARLLGEPEPALEDSPIVSAHLLFDRRVLRYELAALLGSPAHWVFDRGRLTGREPRAGQYLTVVSSGAPELLEVRGPGARRPARRRADGAARAGRAPLVAGQPRAGGDVRGPAGDGRRAAGPGDGSAERRAGRRVDGHGLAGDDGGRGPQRRGRRPLPSGRSA